MSMVKSKHPRGYSLLKHSTYSWKFRSLKASTYCNKNSSSSNVLPQYRNWGWAGNTPSITRKYIYTTSMCYWVFAMCSALESIQSCCCHLVSPSSSCDMFPHNHSFSPSRRSDLGLFDSPAHTYYNPASAPIHREKPPRCLLSLP